MTPFSRYEHPRTRKRQAERNTPLGVSTENRGGAGPPVRERLLSPATRQRSLPSEHVIAFDRATDAYFIAIDQAKAVYAQERAWASDLFDRLSARNEWASTKPKTVAQRIYLTDCVAAQEKYLTARQDAKERYVRARLYMDARRVEYETQATHARVREILAR